MLYNTQEMLSRKLKEETDFQQAIESQGRRLLNLQLLDLKNNNHQHQHRSLHGLLTGSPPTPTILHSPNNQTPFFPVDDIDQDVPRGLLIDPQSLSTCTFTLMILDGNEGNIYCLAAGNGGNPDAAVAQNAVSDVDKEGSPACDHNDGNSNHRDKEEKSNNEESYLHEK
jgi:hypothetical protein